MSKSVAPKARKIKPRVYKIGTLSLYVTGWLSGKDTYLWLGDGSGETGGRLLGVIQGRSFCRLAKAIVRHVDNT